MASKSKEKSPGPEIMETDKTQFQQTVSVKMYDAMEDLRKEKSFDSVQAMVRFAMGRFLRENGISI